MTKGLCPVPLAKLESEPYIGINRVRRTIPLAADEDTWIVTVCSTDEASSRSEALAGVAGPAGPKEPRKGGDGTGTAVITPMEFVVAVLRKYFNKGPDEANRIMLHVHHHGVGECGIFTYEVAETKVTQVMDFARKHQHPLQCIMEKK